MYEVSPRTLLLAPRSFVNPVKPLIFNVRHGESITNVDRNLHDHIADPAVWLTEKGKAQAKASAESLVAEFRRLPPEMRPPRIRLYRSNYRRARETAYRFVQAFKDANLGITVDVKTESRMRELEFGYGGFLTEPNPAFNTMNNLLRYQGYKYFATRLGGESPAHMEPRVRFMLSAIYRDFEKNGISTFIVVNHGITSRVLTMARYGLPPEWYEESENPDNAAIAFLPERYEDYGYVFPAANGQWDPDWKPDAKDKGNPKLNQQGRFVSPDQMTILREAQKINPHIMSDLALMLGSDRALTITEAMKALGI
jgi:broad specificity phosphatase PhoE